MIIIGKKSRRATFLSVMKTSVVTEMRDFETTIKIRIIIHLYFCGVLVAENNSEYVLLFIHTGYFANKIGNSFCLMVKTCAIIKVYSCPILEIPCARISACMIFFTAGANHHYDGNKDQENICGVDSFHFMDF